MSRARTAVVVVIAVAGLAAACSQGAAAPHRTAAPQPTSAAAIHGQAAAMARYMTGLAAAGRFAGAVLVATGGRVVLQAGYGLANRAARTPDQSGTIFQVGSVTKQFTAMAITILAARGQLQLDGHACDYLPDCPSAWRPITVTELLDHTSGIADWSSWRLSGPLPGELANPITAIVRQAEREPMAFRPGSRAGYSNPGYVVLGDIIERVTGMSYGAFLRAHIFTPLTMTRTGVYTGQRPGPGSALGYLAGGAVAPAALTADSSAAGAIYSTTGDLYRWDQALITGQPRLVPPALLRQILTVHAPCPYQSCPLPADRGYGYGWFIGTGRAGRLVNHSGSVLGFWAYNGFYPDRDTAVIILSNLDTVQINPISAELNTLATQPSHY